MIERQRTARKAIDRLTADEAECLRMIVAGESMKVIAARRRLSPAQAVAARRSLMEKLGANCTADAFCEGIYAGF